MLNHVSDVLSIWEIAHRWYKEDPNGDQNDNIPLNVKDLLRVFSKLLYQHEMQLCKDGIPQWNYSFKIDRHGYGIEHCVLPDKIIFNDFEIRCVTDAEYLQDVFRSIDDIHCEVYEIDPTRIPAESTERCCCYTLLGEEKKKEAYEWYEEYAQNRSQFHIEKVKDFDKCFRDRIFEKKLLDDIYIREDELAKFCKEKKEKLPEFWFGKSGHERYDYYQRYYIDADITNNDSFSKLKSQEKMNLINLAAVDAYDYAWGNYVESDKSTWVKGGYVTDYLRKKYGDQLNVHDRKSIQVAIRPPETVLTIKKG